MEPWRRGVALAAALALQALLLLMLEPMRPIALPPLREIILPLTPLRIETPPKVSTKHRKHGAAAARAVPPASTLFRLDLPPSNRTAPQALKGLGGALFGCEPSQILNEGDRRRCAEIAGAPKPDVTGRVMNPVERSKAAAMWARDVGRKQQPVLLPCASPQGVGIGLGTILCLAKGVTEGFDLRAQPGYMDKPAAEYHPNRSAPVPLSEPNRD